MPNQVRMSETVISVRQDIVRLIVDHLDALFSKSGQRSAKPGEAVCNTRVVLDIIVAFKIAGEPVGILAAQHVADERSNDLAGLFLIDNLLLHRTVGLRMARGVGIRLGSEVVPMLCNQAVLVDAEDVKSHLFTGSGEVVNGLQEHLVAVLEGADVVYGGLNRRGSQPCHAADESIAAGAVCQVVLNVALCQKSMADSCQCMAKTTTIL